MCIRDRAYATNANHTGFKNYDQNQMKMYTSIVDAVKKAANLVGIKMCIRDRCRCCITQRVAVVSVEVRRSSATSFVTEEMCIRDSYTALSPSIPTLSKTTVYNTLKLLRDVYKRQIGRNRLRDTPKRTVRSRHPQSEKGDPQSIRELYGRQRFQPCGNRFHL